MKAKCEATGKVQYKSVSEAKEAMYRIRTKWKLHWHGKRRKHRQGKPAQKRAYCCEFCGTYHLTRIPDGAYVVKPPVNTYNDLSLLEKAYKLQAG